MKKQIGEPRIGTCIRVDPDTYIARCEHGTSWRIGATLDLCDECVLARCNHEKHGIDQEQMGLDV